MKEKIRLYIRNFINENLDEKAVSKSQQQFMGMVRNCQENPGDCGKYSKSVKDAAGDMKKTDVDDFASTKHKGLPDHVEESEDTKLNPDNGIKYASKICDNLWSNNNMQDLEKLKGARKFRDNKFPEQTLKQVSNELET